MQDILPKFSEEFRLEPGERITACAPLTFVCDRILEELADCHHCRRPVHRVVTITSSRGLERRASLCEHHFIEAAKNFPELKNGSGRITV